LKYKKSGLIIILVLLVLTLATLTIWFGSEGITGAVIGLPLEFNSSEEMLIINESANSLDAELPPTNPFIENITLNESLNNQSNVLTESAVEESLTQTAEDRLSDSKNQVNLNEERSHLSVHASCTTWPCNCGDTLTASVTMTNGLHCTTDGLKLNTNNVILDCAGNQINYSTAGSAVGFGVIANNVTNVTVKNCNLFEKNVTIDAKHGIYFDNATSSIIQNNNISIISAYTEGIYLSQSNSTTISSNNITTNSSGSDGLYALSSSNLIIQSNIIKADDDGIYLGGTTSSTINQNNITSYNGDAIQIIETILSTFTANNFTSYGETILAVRMDTVGSYLSINNTLKNNKIFTNGTTSWGISVEGNWSKYESNIIITERSGASGIRLGPTSAFNQFINNNISVNYSGGGTWDIRDDSGTTYENYLIYNNSFGEIRWVNNGSGNFTGDLDLDGFIGLGLNLSIENNSVALDTSAFDKTVSRINSTANITISELGFGTITHIFYVHNFTTNETFIRSNGQNCMTSFCSKLHFGLKKVIFNVSYMGSFTANGTEVTVNTAPDTAQIIVNASSTDNKTTDNLNCWTKGSDNEQTLLRAYWMWYKNGIEFSTGYNDIYNGSLTLISTVTSNNTDIGQVWNCSVGIYDGLANETQFNNASVIISSLFCGEDVTTSTTLTTDILNCASNYALNITANHTVLDCNNHKITGNGSAGIYASQTNNITIKNCNITGFGDGIYLYNLSLATILNNSISNSTRAAIEVNHNNFTRIVGNVISDTIKAGIFINQSTKNSLIANNTILRNIGTVAVTEAGFSYLDYSAGLTLLDYSDQNNTIMNNNLSNNFRRAVFSRAWNNTFKENFIFNNTVGYELNNYENNFTNEKVINNSIGINITMAIGSGNRGVNFRDSNFTNNIVDLNIVEGVQTEFNFTNTSLNKNKLNVPANSFVYVKQYIYVNVTNPLKIVLENVIVKADNSIGLQEANESTTPNGMARLEVTEFFRSNNINYYLTPSTIKASKNNFTSNSTTLNLYNQTNLNTNLTITEIVCGATITSDFSLGNAYICPNTAIIVNADNLIIEGNNNNITGSGNNVGINLSGRKNITINYLRIQNFTRGLELINTNNSNITGLVIINNSVGIYLENSHNNKVYDSILGNNTNVSLYAVDDGSKNTSLINVSININSINVSGTASVFLKWYVGVNATFNGNNPLSNGNIYGYLNNTNTMDDSAITASNGIARLTLSELKKNSTEVISLTPHNITLIYDYKNNNITNSTSLNLTKTNSTTINLSITLDCTVPTTNLFITAHTTFCPGTFAVENITISQNGINLTCDGTVLKGNFPGSNSPGITISQKNHIKINGCNLDDYYIGLDLYGNNITINNVSIIGEGTGVESEGSTQLTINGSSFSNNVDVYLYSSTSGGSNNSLIISNRFRGVYNILVSDSFHNVIKNNTFIGGDQAIFFNEEKPSSNNSIYYNNFSSLSSFYIRYRIPSSYVNFFNTSSGGYAQGNEYSDYCNKGSDLNADGYADNDSSASVDDWPYSENISSKISDSTDNNGGVIDYGPKITTCQAENVFLGSSGGSSAAASTAAPAAAPAAPAPGFSTYQKPPEKAPEDYSTLEEIKKHLKTNEIIVKRTSENIMQVAVKLENTGDQKMKLFPGLDQETEDPLYIVTKKTVGFEGSFFNKLAGIAYSENTIAGRLLQAEIIGAEEIVLNPGESIEKTLEIKDGLIPPKQIKIKFSSFGETVTEQEIKIEPKKILSGTAIDIESEQDLMDVYAIMVPEKKDGKNNQDNAITGNAIGPAKVESNLYYLEIKLTKKGSDKDAFVDWYGPYHTKPGQYFIFAQQFKYGQPFKGDYLLKTKIYQGNELVTEAEHEVKLE